MSLLFWADSSDLTCFHLPSFYSGWGRMRREPRSASRTPISLSLSTQTPVRCCRRGTKWVSVFLSVCISDYYTASCSIIWYCCLAWQQKPKWFVLTTVLNHSKLHFLLPDDIIVCFVLLQIREQNRFDVMTSGPRSQHLAGIPDDAPRRVRLSSLSCSGLKKKNDKFTLFAGPPARLCSVRTLVPGSGLREKPVSDTMTH